LAIAPREFCDKYNEEFSLFHSFVDEISSKLIENKTQSQAISRRGFKFKDDKYTIESDERSDYSAAIHELVWKPKEQLFSQLPVFENVLQRFRKYFSSGAVLAGVKDETPESDYWRAWSYLPKWAHQCFFLGDSLNPSVNVIQSVFLDRFGPAVGEWPENFKSYIIPIHGLTWNLTECEVDTNFGFRVVHLTDEIKSEGWYDSWFDFGSTNPRDISYCQVAIVGKIGEESNLPRDFLDALRLAGAPRFSAPDRFSPRFEFSIVGATHGSIEDYGPIIRHRGSASELTAKNINDALRITNCIANLRRKSRWKYFELPVRRFVIACSRNLLADQLLDMALSIEALLVPGGKGDKFINGAAILAANGKNETAKLAVPVLKTLQNARNKIAHTGDLDWVKIKRDHNEVSSNKIEQPHELFELIREVTSQLLDSAMTLYLRDKTTKENPLFEYGSTLLAKGVENFHKS
jgi:hypothetical protein